MTIDKSTLKILSFIYRHPFITHQKVLRKFPCAEKTLEQLVHCGYISAIDTEEERTNEGGRFYHILPNSKYKTLPPGNDEVEKNQWFNTQYILTSLLLPVIVGVSSSLITAVILSILS